MQEYLPRASEQLAMATMVPGWSCLLCIQAAPMTPEERSMETRSDYLETQKSPDKLETPYINHEEALSPRPIELQN